MATQAPNAENFLYLDQITLQGVTNPRYQLGLFVENQKIELERRGDSTWTPVQRLDIFPTSEMRVDVQRITGHQILVKSQQTNEVIDLQGLFEVYWGSNMREFTVPKVVAIGKHQVSLELRFSANATAESLRSSLKELDGWMKGYTPLMSKSMERALGKGIQFGTVGAQFNPITQVVFGVAKVIFELLKEQIKSDEMPSSLLDHLQRILPLAEKVADEIACDETEILGKIMSQMFEVMQKIAKFLCEYVKRGRFKRTGAALFSSKDKDRIKELDEELANVIKHFLNAVDVEALRLARTMEQKLLLKRLKPIETGYHQTLRCMEGTRKSRLKEIVNWVANKSEERDLLHNNTYWIYGLPGIGKTTLAHSICASLHDQRQLAGAFFCRRDDVNLSDPTNILPTLMYKLAENFPPFRKIVANYLRNDPNLTPKSMKGSLFLDLLDTLPYGPNNSLVFVIDAFDECGNHRTRPALLKLLTDAAASSSWLKIIITSRPEADIQRVFDGLTRSSYLQYDLAKDQEASHDLRTFAESEFALVAQDWDFPPPWPEESLLVRLISRADGLFIFIKTLSLALEHCVDPTDFLEATSKDAGAGLKSLYGLYSNILKSQIVHGNAEFQRVIGVLLTAAPYRVLCEETIAELAGVGPNLVKKWVKDLSSLLYRDEGTNGGIRVRHLSISEFLVSDDCPCDYRIC